MENQELKKRLDKILKKLRKTYQKLTGVLAELEEEDREEEESEKYYCRCGNKEPLSSNGYLYCPFCQEQILGRVILPDGRCNCNCGDKCPLGKTGLEVRCTRGELIRQSNIKGFTGLRQSLADYDRLNPTACSICRDPNCDNPGGKH